MRPDGVVTYGEWEQSAAIRKIYRRKKESVLQVNTLFLKGEIT